MGSWLCKFFRIPNWTLGTSHVCRKRQTTSTENVWGRAFGLDGLVEDFFADWANILEVNIFLGTVVDKEVLFVYSSKAPLLAGKIFVYLHLAGSSKFGFSRFAIWKVMLNDPPPSSHPSFMWTQPSCIAFSHVNLPVLQFKK